MVLITEYEVFANEAMSMFKANPLKTRLVLKYRVDRSVTSDSTTTVTSSSSSSSSSSASTIAPSASTVAAPGRLVVRATDGTRTILFKTRELQDLKNCERLQLWLLNETATNETLFSTYIADLTKKSTSLTIDHKQNKTVSTSRIYPKMSGAQRRKVKRAEKASMGAEGLIASRVKSDIEKARDEKAAIKKARKLERRLQRKLEREG